MKIAQMLLRKRVTGPLRRSFSGAFKPVRGFYAWFAGVGLILIGLFIVFAEWLPGGRVGQAYGPNLVASVFEVTATVVVVDQVLSWRRRKETEEIRKAAQVRLERLAGQLKQLMLFMYKAASAPDGERPSTASGLIAPWASEVRRLDVQAAGPVSPPVPWFQYISFTTGQIEDHVVVVLDRFGEHIDDEIVVAFERVFALPLWGLMKQLSLIYGAGRETAPQRAFDLIPVEPGADLYPETVDTLHALFSILESKRYRLLSISDNDWGTWPNWASSRLP